MAGSVEDCPDFGRRNFHERAIRIECPHHAARQNYWEAGRSEPKENGETGLMTRKDEFSRDLRDMILKIIMLHEMEVGTPELHSVLFGDRCTLPTVLK